MIPSDPEMLRSYLNTKLRDEYASLTELCDDLELSEEEITERLRAAGYAYKAAENRFA